MTVKKARSEVPGLENLLAVEAAHGALMQTLLKVQI
jgi:hypothetical protein